MQHVHFIYLYYVDKDSRIPKHMQEYIAAAPALFSEWDKEIEVLLSVL